MPLLDLLEKGRDTVLTMSAAQVLAIAGDGNLKDGSQASSELREFLTLISIQQIEKYAQECLVEKMPLAGLFLQDIVNELGRRLENTIDYGLYRGVKGKIGYDGLWILPENHTILVEVKSSTTYSISLDTIFAYHEQLKDNGKIETSSSILIAVGSEDTRSLEAQIRGSRYAWDIRVISVEALIKLVKIKESAEEEATLKKIRELLIPFEYTKLDGIIDIMFATTSDIEESIATQDISVNEVSINDSYCTEISHLNRTPNEEIEIIKQNLIHSVEKSLSISLQAKSRALYLTKDGKIKIFCAVSKRYPATYAEYWYAYRLSHRKFLDGTTTAYIVLGCMDTSQLFMIPSGVIESALSALNCTESKTGNKYWHLCIAREEGDYVLVTQKGHGNIRLVDYVIQVKGS